ncbi:Bug family tripartite tricarboxylate transporter substrate binding protein [Paracandidimonas soli]|uniref:Bug family tripartite tricarboxylate transporter substrate binding protein n=1 Tax=Paracandidimonas soli TaxID=1917182 RepID=UPI00333EA706
MHQSTTAHPWRSAHQQAGRLLLAALLGAAACSASAAEVPKPSDGFPTRAITLISPFPPGGGNDNTSRLLANELGKVIGQSVVVENRGGAGGNVGVSTASRATPDGYTIVMSQNSVMAINPRIYSNPGFDPIEDFIPVSQITSSPLALVVRSDAPYKTLEDYLSAAQKQPGHVSYATPGSGTLSHLSGTILAKQRKIDLLHVPYRGAGPAINDLMGGQVNMLITSAPSVQALVQDGSLRVLAITNDKGLGVFKDVPTTASMGLPELTIDDWYGVFAPKGTPPERVAYLNAAIREALRDPEAVKKLNGNGAHVVASETEEFAKVVAKEVEYWKDIVRDAGVQVQ